MTCKELHAYWESELGMATGSQSIELSEHLAVCPDCSRFVEEQKELSNCLLMIRNSAPDIPASLDTTVIDNYRRHMSQQPRPAVSLGLLGRIPLPDAFRWAGAVAFAVAVAYAGALLFFPRQHGFTDRPVLDRLVTSAPQVPAAPKQKATPVPAPIRKKASSTVTAAKRNQQTSGEENDSSLAGPFHGLMYCDQISCPDEMDVIRVQLPSPALGAMSAAVTPANGLISADVLVGPDGIARGIRVVE